MKTASDVKTLVDSWIADGKDKAFIVRNAAEACLGWPYVWGAVGSECNPSRRQYYAGRDVCPEGEKREIIAKCQALNGSGRSCGGCAYYPDNGRTLCNDCQGFVKNICGRVGITFTGGGATSMWNGSSNWAQKGTRDTLPEQLCCIFWQDSDGKTMNHIGFYIGGGMMIHCSGTVKKEAISKKVTHWAIPKGLGGSVPTTDKPTLRRGSSGEYVTLMQTKLIQRGYTLAPYGADGKFGSITEMAVRGFQRDHNLVVDGICGRNTWTALDDGKDPTYTVTVQHLSRSVAEDLVTKYGGSMTAEGV